MIPSPFRLLLTLGLAWLMSLSAQAATRQVQDVTGAQYQVPAQPQRVVTLSEIDLDITLALGMAPIGTINGRGQSQLPRYLAKVAPSQLVSVGELDNPNLERLIQLQPDLILSGPLKPEMHAVLNQIAPTLVTGQWGSPWQEVLQRSATILNREAQAHAFLERYRQRVAQIRQQLAAHQGQSLSIVRWNPKGPSYMYKDAFASRVAQELGLVRPAHQQEAGHTHSPALSLEALERLDGDWLVIGTLSATGEAVDAMQQATSLPAFRQLGAIRNQHYSAVDGSLWTSVGGPLAAMQVMTDLQQLLAPSGAQPTL